MWLRWSKAAALTDKALFTPAAWYVYSKPDAQVSARQRRAMCIDEGLSGKTGSVREHCQNIYTPFVCRIKKFGLS